MSRDLKPLQNQTISASSLVAGLQSVQSNGVYSAVFDAFDPAQSGPNSSRRSDTSVRVLLSEDQIGPPYLLFGRTLTAMNANVTQTQLELVQSHS